MELVDMQRELANAYEAEYGNGFADSLYRAAAMLWPNDLRNVYAAYKAGAKLDDLAHDIFGLNPLAPEWHKSTFVPRVAKAAA